MSEPKAIAAGRSGAAGTQYSEEDMKKFMQAAIDVAQAGLSQREVPVGCVIVFQGRVVATGAQLCRRRVTDLTCDK